MSVTAHSPYAGAKRFLSEEDALVEASLSHCASLGPKRARGSPRRAARRAGDPFQAAGPISASVVAALRGLFPEMNDEQITSALDKFGDDVDAAIAHLNALRLRPSSSAGAGAPAASSSPCPRSPGSAAATPPRSPSAPLPARCEALVREASASIVQSLQGSSSAEEARARAETVLRPFARAVAREAAAELQAAAEATPAGPAGAGAGAGAPPGEAASSAPCAAAAAAAPPSPAASCGASPAVSGASGASGSTPASSGSDLARENQLLRRAVAIQAHRLAEAAAAREAGQAELRREAEAARAKVRELEVHNYALQLHLARSQGLAGPGCHPGGGDGGLPHNPDVY